LNKTIGTNRKLKVDIDIMRQEVLFSSAAIKTLRSQITDLKEKSLSAAKVSHVQGRAADETNNQILALKVHTEKENNEFENQLQTL
jgi:hypothetical protein